MFTIPKALALVLTPFRGLFSAPVWQHAIVLLTGAILCRGRRTVTAVLRVMGLSEEQHFINYHRVLSRAKWSSLQAAKILLGMLVTLLPEGFPILIGIDETIERRKGKKIKAKGCYRDAVRSTDQHVIRCFGLQWIAMMLLVPLPWNTRCWALPFFTVLAPSEKSNIADGRRHKTTLDWACSMVRQVSRWLNRKWVCIGDGGYACVNFAWVCVQQNVTLISRLRWDAQLYDFPEPQLQSKRGRKPTKGKRLAALKTLVNDETHNWLEEEVKWYGKKTKKRRILTGVSLWYTSGEKPIPIRWVIVVDPEGQDRCDVLFTTDTTLNPVKIIEWFILRWGVEVTFEETRAHLGVETQRQWSPNAIARTTPALFGLFSLVCLIALHLSDSISLQPNQAIWYDKKQTTFSDVLAFVRRHLWQAKYLSKSTVQPECVLFSSQEWEMLLNQLASAA